MVLKKHIRLAYKERVQIKTFSNENKTKAYIAKIFKKSVTYDNETEMAKHEIIIQKQIRKYTLLILILLGKESQTKTQVY